MNYTPMLSPLNSYLSDHFPLNISFQTVNKLHPGASFRQTPICPLPIVPKTRSRSRAERGYGILWFGSDQRGLFQHGFTDGTEPRGKQDTACQTQGDVQGGRAEGGDHGDGHKEQHTAA